uniref:Uncharacterized protein n=1 Tax=Nelumbo nucifera TaxID=4432 RepID=A0A822YVY6_NELNU|nr:TPA_asm: hypothetical protein HUJ06_012248 [Nelumbo nucifera]
MAYIPAAGELSQFPFPRHHPDDRAHKQWGWRHSH